MEQILAEATLISQAAAQLEKLGVKSSLSKEALGKVAARLQTARLTVTGALAELGGETQAQPASAVSATTKPRPAAKTSTPAKRRRTH